jgi:adenosylmethionine-8-amino-7-oxononanoate aminotransferase
MSVSHVFSRGADQLYEMVKGEGVYLWDREGRRYIDGSSGPICVNIGHGVKEVADAVKRQMDEVSYVHSSHFITRSVKE